jgi:hypothetical protein
LAKTIPTQFPAPSLVTLVTPVGNVSLQGLLWTSIGASTAYQMFTGVMEVIAGVLLLIPATATFGAAISLTVMAEIVALNLTYDVGLKQISFHLLLLSAFLLAPFAGRIVRAFQGKNVVEREMNLDPIQTSSARSLSPWLHLALGIYLIGMYGYIARSWWYSAGEGATKSPLYGIWNVRRLTVDGVSQPADLNDYDRRWRRVIFDDPGAAVFQRTDDSFARYRASIDVGAQKLELTRSASKTWSSQFMFQRPAEDRMILEGEMDSHQISVELDRVEMDTFRVNNSSFRWVRPPDPNTVSEREISSE